jgi:hypothetical protein
LPAPLKGAVGARLGRGEIADPATDDGAEDRPDERQWNGDDGADGSGNRGALGKRSFEYDPALSTCIIHIIHQCGDC